MSALFPKWMNALPTLGAGAAFFGLIGVVWGTWYWATPDYTRVGYMPTQPGTGFNHQLHAGQLGIDCRYCHTKVEKSPEANIPNVATCMGCHAEERLRNWDIHRVGFVREAYAEEYGQDPGTTYYQTADYVPVIPVTYWSFRFMIGLGMAAAAGAAPRAAACCWLGR